MSIIERNLEPFLKLLDKSVSQTLLLVEAPEGYGKTTLLQQIQQWCTLNSTPCMYVNLNQTSVTQQLKPENLLLKIAQSCYQCSLESSGELEKIIYTLQKIIRPFIADTIKSTFNLEEFHSFCFDLSVDYQDFTRQNREGIIEEFLLYIERYDRQVEFLSKLKQKRPNIDWSTWYWEAYLTNLSQISKYEDIAKVILQSLDIYSLETTLNRTTRLLTEGLQLCKQQRSILLIDSLNPNNQFREIWEWLEKNFLAGIARNDLPLIAVIAGRNLSHIKTRWSKNALAITLAPFTITDIRDLANQQNLNLNENDLSQVLTSTEGIPKKAVLALEVYRKKHFEDSTFPKRDKDYSQNLLEFMPLVEEILQFQPKEIKGAFIASAIPHQFDSSLLANLLDIDSKESDRLFKRISESPLTRKQEDFKGYDVEVRNYLLEIAKEDQSSFLTLNLRAASWFLTKLPIDVVKVFNVKDEDNANNKDLQFIDIRKVLDSGYHLEMPELVGYLAEALYHLLIVDNHSAFTYLQEIFIDLEAYGLISSGRYLLIVMDEQKRYLTPEQIYFVDYYHCRLHVNLGEWHLAEEGLWELSQNPLPENLRRLVSDALVSLLLEMGKGKEALSVCQKVELIIEGTGTDQSLNEVLIQLHNSKAKAFKLCGKFEDAINQYAIALQIAEEEDILPFKADSLLKIGRVHRDLGEWPRALDSCHKALSLYQSMSHAIGTIDTFIALGNIYQTQGNWELAEENYHKALQKFEELGEDANFLQAKAVTFANFAEIYIKQGEWEKGSQALTNFQQIAEDLDNLQLLATAYLMRGRLYKEQGNWQYAVDYYNRARKLHKEKTGNPVELGNALAELSELYRLRGMWTPTVKYLDEALENWRSLA